MSFSFHNMHQQPWNHQFPDMYMGVNSINQGELNPVTNQHQALDECMIKNEDCEAIDSQLFNNENLKNLQFQFQPGLNEQIPDNFPQFPTHSVSNSSDISHSPININNQSSRPLLPDNNTISSDVAPLPIMDTSGQIYPSPQQSQNNQSSNDETLTEEEILKRRKAQNRAAQRAFRERKEMKLKELEEKLDQSERNRNDLISQLDDLRKRNIVIQAENKILLQNTNGNIPIEFDSKDHSGQFSFPTNDPFYSNHASFLKNTRLSKFQHNINHYTHNGHETVSLGVNGVWEFVNEYNDKNEEDIDANLVLFKLKGKEVCKASGPAYDVGFVIETLKQVIEEENQNQIK